MQELVVVTSCDIEYSDMAIRVEAEEVIWHLGGKPWVIDLCKEHRDSLAISQMESIVEALGRPLGERHGSATPGSGKKKGKPQSKVEGSTAASGGVEGEPIPCPHPDCEEARSGGKTYAHRGSLSGHFRHAHGQSLAAWEAEQAGLVADLKCKHKNCRRKFHTSQARASHMASAHGWRREENEVT